MVQAADAVQRDHIASAVGSVINRAAPRGVLVQGVMKSVLVVIADILRD